MMPDVEDEPVDRTWRDDEDGSGLDSIAETSLTRTRKRVENAIFGMMYTLVKENDLYKVLPLIDLSGCSKFIMCRN